VFVPIDRNELPDDPETLRQMVVDMSSQMDKMHRQIDYLTRQLFGRKSEKFKLESTQGTLFSDDDGGDGSGEASADEAPDPAASADKNTASLGHVPAGGSSAPCMRPLTS